MSQKSELASDTVTRRNAVLTEQNPIEVLQDLPPTVFPIECRFSIAGSRSHDSADSDFRKPEYPVDLHHAAGVYVPETTVHFDNPAVRPPENSTAWRPREFTARITELLDDDLTNNMTEDDITLTRFSVVEVPHQLVTTDAETGENIVKPALYSEEYEMAIARFQKHSSLSAARVRNDLSEALPGESRTPVRLTDLREVTAKPARHGRQTTGSPGRKRYYTDAEAEKTGDLSRTPAHYQSQYLNRESDRTRPLSPAVADLKQFLPEMVQGSDDLVRVVKFVGHEEERRSFVAEEVRS